jgi:hypothetical protein
MAIAATDDDDGRQWTTMGDDDHLSPGPLGGADLSRLTDNV